MFGTLVAVVAALCLGYYLAVGRMLRKHREMQARLEEATSKQLQAESDKQDAAKKLDDYQRSTLPMLFGLYQEWQDLYMSLSVGSGNAQSAMLSRIALLERRIHDMSGKVVKDPSIAAIRAERDRLQVSYNDLVDRTKKVLPVVSPSEPHTGEAPSEGRPPNPVGSC